MSTFFLTMLSLPSPFHSSVPSLIVCLFLSHVLRQCAPSQ